MTLTPTTRASLLLRLRDPRDHDAWVEFVSLYEPVIYRVLRRDRLAGRRRPRSLAGPVSGREPEYRTLAARGGTRLISGMVAAGDPKPGRLLGSAATATADNLVSSISIRYWSRKPADDGPETDEFDRELRRALFHRASEQVRAEVRPQTWQAFWDVAVSGTSVAETAGKLGMTTGAVRVAKCRIISRLSVVVAEMEKAT